MAECFWPGVTVQKVADTGERVRCLCSGRGGELFADRALRAWQQRRSVERASRAVRRRQTDEDVVGQASLGARFAIEH